MITTKQRIPDSVRQEMQMRMKNQIDISDLIAPYSIRGEDLTGAIIKTFNRSGEDLSNLNLTNAVIGEENTETYVSRAIAHNCCFKSTRFLGTIIAKKTDFTGSDFTSAHIPGLEYKFADMRKCTFCGAVFNISTENGYGANFDENLFKDLAKHWSVKVITNEEYERLKSYEPKEDAS